MNNETKHTPTKAYRVMRGACIIGRVQQTVRGWYYLPYNDRQNVSRKLWPTAESAVKGRVQTTDKLQACQ